MKKLLSTWLFLSLTLLTYSQKKCFRIGIHADAGNMFTNIFRGAGLWTNGVPMDSNGYPTRVPYQTIKNVTYNVDNFQSHFAEDTTYVMRWDGDGNFSWSTWYHPNQVIESLHDTINNRIVFKVKYNTGDKYNDQYQINLNIIRSNASNHIHNIRIYKQRFEDLYENQGQEFNPDYLDKVKPFYMYRFMGAFSIVNSQLKTWAERTPPNYYNQTSGPHGQGLSYEWACNVCNYTKKHMWFNVPHLADDDAVRKMAQTVYKNLSPDLNIYLEYSNECFNWGFGGQSAFYYLNSKYNGNALWGQIVESKRIFRIWRQVFGRDSLRVKRTITVMPFTGVGSALFNGIDVADYDVYSITYYYPTILNNCDDNAAITQMQAQVRTTAKDSWYDVMKYHANHARDYGKECYCYEGGSGSDPSCIGNVCYAGAYAEQHNPRMKDFAKEVFDTLTNLGFAGGNELSLVGGLWKPIAVGCGGAGYIGFWGLIDRIDADKTACPKYMGVLESIKDCDKLDRVTDTIGSGNAFRFDGSNDYADLANAFKPNDATNDYTIETWVKPEWLGADQYVWSMSSGLNNASNMLYIGTDNRVHWVVKNNTGGQVVSLTSSFILNVNQYYHIAVVKSGTQYKLYINGTEKASGTGNISGDCSRNRFIFAANINAGKMSGFFRGKLDELRIWNTGITNITTFRNWMCRKITSSHPSYANLTEYYNFDVVDATGKLAEKKNNVYGQLNNVNFSQYSNYEKSGAPIGNDSRQLYPTGWKNASLTYTHSTGDRMTVTNLGAGNPEGVHIYWVCTAPSDPSPPNVAFTKVGSYYFGVFTANGTNAAYKVIYNYQGNPDASTSDLNNRLLKRTDNADPDNWQNTGASLDRFAKTVITRGLRESYKSEYIIGVRPNTVKDMPGPGYAMHFTGGGGNMYFKRPDDNWTASYWYRPDNGGDGLRFLEAAGLGETKINHNGDITNMSSCRAGAWCTNSAWNYSMDRTGPYNHVCMIKKNGVISLYLNGYGILSITPGMGENGKPKDADMTKLALGNMTGYMDDLQVWDTAFTEKDVRTWMCRKITKHPLQNDRLLLYLNFNEGQGSSVENSYGMGDMQLTGSFTWVPSGAPLGDTSVYFYPTQVADSFKMPNRSLSISHRDGDIFKVVMNSDPNWGYARGIQLYRVDGAAQLSTLPVQIKSWDSTRYYGAFIVPESYWGSMHQYGYDAYYYYEKNKNILIIDSTRLLDRLNNSVSPWHLNNVPPDKVNKYFKLSFKTPNDNVKYPFWPYNGGAPTEILIGGLTSQTIVVDTSKPKQPSVITGRTNVCAGETQLIYSVVKNTMPDIAYVWTLPPVMSGYSDSNKIIVNVDPKATSGTYTISVYARNRYGAGPARTLSVTVQSTPSLSVDINGPSEVCSGQTATYSIPPVPGAVSYNWFITDDGSIVSNKGTSIDIKFGSLSGIISVLGAYTCGSSVINSKPVTVNILPLTTLNVAGNNFCRGVDSFGLVTIFNNESGVKYQAYKNAGTAPVGSPGFGTGQNLTLQLPLTDLLPGNNLITIKASKGSCAEVTLTNQASVRVDISPDPAMPIVYDLQVCKGQPAIIKFPNAMGGMVVVPSIKSYWRCDDAAVKSLDYGFTLKEPDLSMAIPPSNWNCQLSGSLNMGKNEISFRVTNGSCPSVQLNRKILVTVPNEPRAINFSGGPYCCLGWWIFTGNPWLEVPDTSKWIIGGVPGSACSTDTITVSIRGAEKDILYYVRSGSEQGPIVSDSLTCAVEMGTIFLHILPGKLPVGKQSLYIMAKGTSCEISINTGAAYGFEINITQGVDKTIHVIGSTTCIGGDGTITVQSGQSGVTYQVYQNGNPVGSIPAQTGNNSALTFTVPSALLPAPGNYNFRVRGTSSGCGGQLLNDTAKISVVTSLKNDLVVKSVCDSICKGLDLLIRIYKPQTGIMYYAMQGATVVSDTAVGAGDSIDITVPYSKLTALSTQTFTIQASGGSCAMVNLLQTCSTYVNNVDISDENVRIMHQNLDDWNAANNNKICPSEPYPFHFLQHVSHADANAYPVQTRIMLANAFVPSVGTQSRHIQPGTGWDEWATVLIDSVSLPRGTQKSFSTWVKQKGCSWHQAMNVTGAGGNINPSEDLLAYPPYVLNSDITSDSICAGNTTAIGVKYPSSWYGEYPYTVYIQAYNNKMTTTVSNQYDSFWGFYGQDPGHSSSNRYLWLRILDPKNLPVGVDTFHVKVWYGTNWLACPAGIITKPSIITVSNPPDLSLPVSGTSQCAGNGTLKVKNTQKQVSYTPYMGVTKAGNTQWGNNGTLSFSVDSAFLAKGVNVVSVRASIKGCPSDFLDSTAKIEVVNKAPEAPGTISGPANVCPGDSGIFTVVNDPSVSSYVWTLPAGAATASSSNIALIKFASNGGQITVQAKNQCGTSAASAPYNVMITSASGGGTIIGYDEACPLQSIQLTDSGYQGSIVKWQYALYPDVWNDVFETTPQIISMPITDTIIYRTIVQSGSCGTSYSDNHTINLGSLPRTDVQATGDTACFGDIALLRLTNNETGVTYRFTDEMGNTVASSSGGDVSVPTITLKAGAHHLTILALRNDACKDTLTSQPELLVKTAPSPDIIANTNPCEGSAQTISSSDTNAVNLYDWSIMPMDSSFNGKSQVTVTWPVGQQTIVLKETDTSGCVKSDTLIVTVNESMTELKCPDDTTIMMEADKGTNSYEITTNSLDPLVVDACGTNSITNSLNGTSTLSGAEIKESGKIEWTVINKANKQKRCSFNIFLEYNDAVIIPSAITPNGDNKNDRLSIKNIDSKTIVRIYDRWGNMVYECHEGCNNEEKFWDGTNMSGNPLPVDAYHYYIDRKDGKKAIMGSVVIIR